MKPLLIANLAAEAVQELDTLYRTTKDVRIHLRALIILLAAEKGLQADEIATIVRTDEQTVRRWLKRYMAHGVNGLSDLPRPGGPRKVTEDFLSLLVEVAHQEPAALQLPFTTWTYDHLAEYMARETGISLNAETLRLHLHAVGVALHPI